MLAKTKELETLSPQAYLTKKQLRAFLGGIGASTINLWIKTRHFPEPRRLSQTMPLWKVGEVIEWVESQGQKQATNAVA